MLPIGYAVKSRHESEADYCPSKKEKKKFALERGSVAELLLAQKRRGFFKEKGEKKSEQNAHAKN